MFEGDNEILETKALRNTLEAYSYEMRNNIDSYGSFEKYIAPKQRDEFLKDINEVVDWLYADGEFAKKSEYTERINRFRKIGEPVKQRHFYYTELDVYFEQFQKIQEYTQAKLGELAHLSDEQRQLVINRFTAAQDFMTKVMTDKESKQLFEDPAFTVTQIQ